MLEHYTDAVIRATEKALFFHPKINIKSKECRDWARRVNALHWKMKQEMADENPTWEDTRLERNKARNILTAITRKIKRSDATSRRIENCLTSSANAWTKLKIIKNIARSKSTPQPQLDTEDVHKFNNYWS
jgi:hypothetical protein